MKVGRMFSAVLIALFCASPAWSEVTAAGTKLDPKADQLLRSMSDLHGKSNNFTFRTSEVHDRMRPTGKMVQAQVTRQATVHRPDGLMFRASVKAPDAERELGLWYDGKTLTLQSDKEKVYSRTKMPPTIDDAIDYAGEYLDMPMPMADVFYSSPYDAMMSPDTTGGYVKLEKIGEKSCHQLAFQNSVVDWRIWIAEGDQPLLCQLEITYKLDEGKPKALMTFMDWNFAPEIAADTFAHQPPADFAKIKIIGRVPLNEEQPQTQPQTAPKE